MIGKRLVQRVILTQSDRLRCVLGIAVYPVLQMVVCDSSCSGSIVGQYDTSVCLSLAEEMFYAMENCIGGASHEMVLLVKRGELEMVLMRRVFAGFKLST